MSGHQVTVLLSDSGRGTLLVDGKPLTTVHALRVDAEAGKPTTVTLRMRAGVELSAMADVTVEPDR